MTAGTAAKDADQKTAGNGKGSAGGANAPAGKAKPQSAASEGAGRQRKQLSPEALKKIAEMRDRLQGVIGQVVMALSAVPRYRHQTLADLHHLVVEPMMRDRIAIASAHARGEGAKEGDAKSTLEPQARESANSANDGLDQLAGIAFWASVSDAVDAKIKEQIKAGAFPIRLKPEEWASGDTVWLLDVIAPSQKLATAVLANFAKVLPKKDGGKSGQVRIHPIVARQIDPELLKKMGAVAEGNA